MAVRLTEFYAHYRSRATLSLIAAQTAIIITAGAAAYLAVPVIRGYTDIDPLYLTLGFFVLLHTVLAPLIVSRLSEPLKYVVEAITHVSKQANDVTPPNINLPRHEKSGLKNVVQTVYELSVGTHQLDIAHGNVQKISGSTPFAKQLLKDVPVGIIALNSERSVVFANAIAPVRVDTNQEQQIDLIFDEHDDIDRWLDECEQGKLKDTKVWARIADRLPDDKDRRIFDVIGYYQKEGPAADTILVAVDRTAEYAPGQEQMDFIALAAHELRGPITVIRGYLEVLETELAGGALSDDQRQLMERLSVSANRLSSYVNNILNVSRYDRKHLKIHLREDRIDDIIKSMLDDLSMRARTQNRLLSINIPAGLPTIAADRNSLSEVIGNLVDNALKYTNEGGQVIVSAAVKDNFLEVSVSDNGIGIPSSLLGHLFTKFYRSHRSRESVGGTGLGLYICKAIVESHGGSIGARSTEGQGSIFSFTVPIYATVAEKLQASNNVNEGIIQSSNGWIKNHAMTRR